MEVTAYFNNIQHFHEKFGVYTCCLYKKDINDMTTFSGRHLPDRSDGDVRGIALANCKFSGFPRELSDLFPKLDHVAINGGLREITKEDLAGFANLKFLDLQGCEIASLPNDLFEYTPNLEVIYFSYNRISLIGENLLEPLKQLKYIDFRGNSTINEVYDEDKTNDLSLDELKSMIRDQCRVQMAFVDNQSYNNNLRVSGAN